MAKREDWPETKYFKNLNHELRCKLREVRNVIETYRVWLDIMNSWLETNNNVRSKLQVIKEELVNAIQYLYFENEPQHDSEKRRKRKKAIAVSR